MHCAARPSLIISICFPLVFISVYQWFAFPRSPRNCFPNEFLFEVGSAQDRKSRKTAQRLCQGPWERFDSSGGGRNPWGGTFSTGAYALPTCALRITPAASPAVRIARNGSGQWLSSRPCFKLVPKIEASETTGKKNAGDGRTGNQPSATLASDADAGGPGEA